MSRPIDPGDRTLRPSIEGNLNKLSWWWWSRWVWLGEGIWVIYLIEGHGFSVGQVLLWEAIAAVTVLLVEVPSGMLADRFGRRRVLLGAGVVSIGCFLLFGLGAGVLLLAAYAAIGVVEASYSGADSAMLYDTLDSLDRSDEFEPRLGRLNGSLMLGFVAFTAIGSLIVPFTSLRFPILLSALLTLPSLVLMWRIDEPPRKGGHAGIAAIGGAALRRLLSTRSMWSVTLLQGVTATSFLLMAVLQQPVLLSHGTPTWAIGGLIAGQMALGAGASWVAGWVGRRLGLNTLFLLVPVAACLSLLAGALDTAWTYGLFIFPSAAFHLVFPYSSAFLSRRVSEQERATVLSLASMAASAIAVTALPLLGEIVDRRGLDAGLVVAAVALSTISLLAYLAWVTSGDTQRHAAGAPAPPEMAEPPQL